MRRYSSSELHELRNEISLRKLLSFLGIKIKLDGKVEVFSCPNCSGFRTAINPETNLCRCFSCARNFNSIELVMEQRKTSFLESLKFLKQHFATLAHSPCEACDDGSSLKISAPNTSSDGCLSALERQLVALATPKQNQCL